MRARAMVSAGPLALALLACGARSSLLESTGVGVGGAASASASATSSGVGPSTGSGGTSPLCLDLAQKLHDAIERASECDPDINPPGNGDDPGCHFGDLVGDECGCFHQLNGNSTAAEADVQQAISDFDNAHCVVPCTNGASPAAAHDDPQYEAIVHPCAAPKGGVHCGPKKSSTDPGSWCTFQ